MRLSVSCTLIIMEPMLPDVALHFNDCTTYNDFLMAFEALYETYGICALSQTWLTERGGMAAYKKAHHLGLKMKIVAEHLKEEESYFMKQTPSKWGPEQVTAAADKLIDERGCIPGYTWLQTNGYGGLLSCLNRNGTTLEQFRTKHQSSSTIKHLSRAKLIHRSWAEVAMADHIWSRNIEVQLGRRYPPAYEVLSGKNAGWYDLEFIATCGELCGEAIMVEIWGDSEKSGPLGTDKTAYCETKQWKQIFNKDNPNFIQLNYKYCYSEEYLTELLTPYIGTPEISRTTSTYDSSFPPVVWHQIDEVMHTAKFICEHIDGGILPGDNWLKKKAPYQERKTFEWEPTEGWGRFLNKVSIMGGLMKIRESIGQCDSNMQLWNHEKVVRAYADFYLEYDHLPAGTVTDANIPAHEDPAAFRRFSKYLSSNLAERHVGSASKAKQEATLLLPESVRSFANEKIKIKKLPRGVSETKHNKYVSRISINGASVNLGTFPTIDEAAEAYSKALKAKQAN